MKQKFLNYSLGCIQKNHPEYDEIKMDELRYGLEGFYLTITKSIVIFSVAFILNVFVEMIFMLFIFNILRKYAFGLHATKSWICLISSGSVFLIFPYISKLIEIPIIVKALLGIIAVVCIYCYAPADTSKRPLIYADRRRKYKHIATVCCVILMGICLVIPNNLYSNLILFGVYAEVVIILPITYRIFHLSYNNYKNYKMQFNQN